jgi:hypothetical protein
MGARYIAFTEVPRREVGLWTRGGANRPAMVRGSGKNPALFPAWEQRIVPLKWGDRRTARHYKALPHRYIPDTDVWIWVDANVRLLIPPERAVVKWLGDGGLAVFNHPDRSCLYDEADFCGRKGKDGRDVLAKQIRKYAADGMPRKWGLAETRCVIRRNTPRMAELGEMWWAEIERHSFRDQVSLPCCCWKMGLRWKVIPGRVYVGEHRTNKDFWFVKHGS